ncbi:MAG: malonyl-ACP O-methyltransferase BioC [Pseudomonadales bacterium]|nr:malonyl-ACP O-methyltransferase BioC [Pseudomonadales bacterium]
MSWSLTRYKEPYAINPNAKEICILIPGWGVGSDIFEWLCPALAQDFIVYLADAISYADMPTPELAAASLQAQIEKTVFSKNVNQNCCVMGWSLGGNIALQLALDFPATVSSLLLLATSPSFIAREHWPQAMAEKTFALFQQGIIKQPQKTLKRFDLLQAKGDNEQKSLSHALAEYRKQQQSIEDVELAAGLELLASFDLSSRLSELNMPIQWCLGEADALVNAAIAEPLRELLPSADIQVLAGVSHLPFLTATDELFIQLKKLVAPLNNKGDERKKIAASFSKAAASYDAAAALQKIVAQNLMEFIPDAQGRPLTILDAGCGTGYWTQRISANGTQVIGLDLAQGMLNYAQQQNVSTQVNFCAGDLENLPFADDSLDVVFSSLAVQWCDSLSLLLNEWHRVLKPGGHICLATLGPKTLYELRESFKTVDDAPHVNQFLSSNTLCEQVNQSPLSLLQLKNEKTVMSYKCMRDLMADLKNIGAQTVLNKTQKSNGLMGKARFKAANAAYESFADGTGLLPATYDVIYFHLQKPAVL